MLELSALSFLKSKGSTKFLYWEDKRRSAATRSHNDQMQMLEINKNCQAYNTIDIGSVHRKVGANFRHS